MKKTLITLLALGSCSMGAELVASWSSFDSLTDTTGDYTIAVSGQSSVTDEGVLHIQSNQIHTATVDLTSANLTMEKGITVSITLSNAGHWGGNKPDVIWSFKTSTEEHAFACTYMPGSDAQYPNKDNVLGFVYAGAGSNVNMTDTALPSLTGDTPVTVTLTILGNEVSMYQNGVLFQSGTFNLTKTNNSVTTEIDYTKDVVGLFSLGSWAGSSLNGRMTADVYNLAIYNGALSAEEVAKLVPEPTTATLSLLALCGLAARRRRK